MDGNLSSLTDDEKRLFDRLSSKHGQQQRPLKELESYRDAEQITQHIGMATPPELRMFEASVNMCGVAVREYVNRQELRAFVRKDGGEKPDESLSESWDFNNMASQSTLLHKEARTFGRGFVSVHSNPDDAEQPLITVESTRSIAVEVNRAARSMLGAARFLREDDGTRRATLYTPMATIHLEQANGWKVTDRDDHEFGHVPMVMFLNEPAVANYDGRPLFRELIPKVDAMARTLTNVQTASESSGIPDKYIFGLSKDDLKDQNGKDVNPWEAYFNRLKVIADSNGKVMSLPAADLKAFTDLVDRLMVYCAVELGLPTRFAGLDTTNPAAEGAIAADETRLVRRVEGMNRLDGDSWSWVMGLAEEFRTGVAPRGNEIRALWHNPATPTYSQRVDGILKLRQSGLLSMRGAWDEMGWSEDRKERELQYMLAEQNDPLVSMAQSLMGGATDAASAGSNAGPVPGDAAQGPVGGTAGA